VPGVQGGDPEGGPADIPEGGPGGDPEGGPADIPEGGPGGPAGDPADIPGGTDIPGGDPTDIPGGVPDPEQLRELRRRRDEADAATVLFEVGHLPGDRRAAAVKTLGTVVGPCLRCAEEEVGILALDTADWLLRRTGLHHPPLSDIV
jgi:hypothetical protein